MSIKVIGAGFGRTGTLSLKFALEQLGFKSCYHMMEVGNNEGHTRMWIDAHNGQLPNWEQAFVGYQATVDWPSCNFWREQRDAFPQAKVILSRRDPDKWYQSVMNTIWKYSKMNSENPDPAAKLRWEMAWGGIWKGVFDGRMDDKAHVIECFERHNQSVIDEVPPEMLLVYEPGQGWEPLCEFLQVPVPDGDYPRTNSTEEFTQIWEKVDAEASDKTS